MYRYKLAEENKGGFC